MTWRHKSTKREHTSEHQLLRPDETMVTQAVTGQLPLGCSRGWGYAGGRVEVPKLPHHLLRYGHSRSRRRAVAQQDLGGLEQPEQPAAALPAPRGGAFVRAPLVTPMERTRACGVCGGTQAVQCAECAGSGRLR